MGKTFRGEKRAAWKEHKTGSKRKEPALRNIAQSLRRLHIELANATDQESRTLIQAQIDAIKARFRGLHK
ncbi:MAG: hypothetical protein NT067_02290 [Candidatus Diapherotrites archaeon]|nr:hypothetical protein [Candidatus Diapherotrites archaeon]